VFASNLGTPLDESNERKQFHTILDQAGLPRRGPHQMRHTFASLLLLAGMSITYVSRQLGHRNAATTLQVYADTTIEKGVERLDEHRPSVARPLHKPALLRLRRTA
jgi:integrase